MKSTLQPLTRSDLYNRRQQKSMPPSSFEVKQCAYCLGSFENEEHFFSVDALFFHVNCLNCAQCFSPLSDQTYYNVDGRLYCEYDYCQNYAPVCQQCHQSVLGSVLKTVKGHYHPQCLKCDNCKNIIDKSLYVNKMNNFCENCNGTRKAVEICANCKIEVLPDERLRFRGDIYHANHFDCKRCEIKLDCHAQIWRDDLYCQKCYDHRLMLTCAQCHKVIDFQNERGKKAGGKYYHINHIFCYKCGLNLSDGEYYSHKGETFCKTCRLTLIGVNCEICQKTSNSMLTVFGKHYCHRCFRCVHCQSAFSVKSTVVNIDNQPICKNCLNRLPKDLRKHVKDNAKSP